MPRPVPPPPSRARTIVLLLIVMATAVALRSAFSYGFVITPERVNFQDNDSWYHMRLIDSITRNWPWRPPVDPFVLNGGQAIPVAPLFDFIVSTAALAAGLGAPSTRTIELVAAWAPVVMAALLPLAVFAAGRRLFDTTAALMAAALVALMPGHLLERSRLGYVDHHILEALLATACFWLTVRATQQESQRARLVAAAWAGVALGAYLLSWASGSFLVSILAAWLVVQTLVEAFTRKSSAGTSDIVAMMAVVALPIVWLLQVRMYQYQFQVASLAGLCGGALIIEAIRVTLARRRVSPAWQPAVLLAISVAGALLARSISPSFSGAFLAQIDRMRPDAAGSMVIEAMPLASFAALPWARVSPFMVLGTGLPLGALGALIIGAQTIRRPRPDWILLMVWTAIALAATILRNRFGYYLVPMLAIMGGWVCAWFLGRVRAPGASRDLVAAAIGALAFAPNLWPARDQARIDGGLSQPWVAALDWLRDSTPPPFPEPGFYYQRYGPGAAATPDYTVMAWWDYGYWITRGAQRVPNANPTQAGAAYAGEFFVEPDQARASELASRSKARYVVLDDQLPFRLVPAPVYVMGKFETIAQWAGRAPADFWEMMYVRGSRGELLPSAVFYPAYYRAMVNRLFLFEGKAVTPSSASVLTFADMVAPDGSRYREITALETFPSHAEADAHLASLGSGPHRLVGLYPDQSPVPLEPVEDFRPVWRSPGTGFFNDKPVIAIFEHLPSTKRGAGNR